MELMEAVELITTQILGKPYDEVKPLVEDAGWSLRLSRKDGNRYVGTCDYKPNRITVAVDNGIITEAGGKKLETTPPNGPTKG